MSDETRKIAAVLFSDIVGFTSAMGQDEDTAIRVVGRSRAVQKELVRKHNGVWLQEIGDGAMCTFDSAVEAAACALEIQRAFHEDPDFQLRIGIHVGDLVFRKTEIGTDIFGDAVNVAARVQGAADAGGICVSERVVDDLRNRKGFVCTFMGEKELKGVNRPIRVYRILDPDSAEAEQVRQQQASGDSPAAAAASAAAASKSVGEKVTGPRVGFIGALAGALVLGLGAFLWMRPVSAPEPVQDDPTVSRNEPRTPVPVEPTPPEVLADESTKPSEPEPSVPASPTFADLRKELLGAAGPWKQSSARVWTEPAPVPNNAAYHIRFEAQCDCAVLLFSIDNTSGEISLLYPNPYEPEGRLAVGEAREIPSSDDYTLRAVGGQGMDILKLFVTSGEFDFPYSPFSSWAATPDEPKRVTQLEQFLRGLDGAEWAAVATPLQIVR